MSAARQAGTEVVPANPRQLEDWRQRILPSPEEIRPGVWSVAVPFDLTPIRFTYCYILAADGGAIVIDPGWDSNEGWDAIREVLHTVQLAPEQPLVQGVVVTHFHPDHLGMAQRLRDATGAWVGLHVEDELLLRRLDTGELSAAAADWQASVGMPETVRAKFTFSPEMLAFRPNADDITKTLHGNEVFGTLAGDLRTMHTPGHTSGHLSLVLPDASLIFTGDHILPRISPSLDFGSRRDGDPLADYFVSLRACAALGDLEVAPAHEYRFLGLTRRVRDLIEHHQERCDEVEAAFSPGRSTWDIASAISWSRPWETLDAFNLRSALTETECHLVYLAARGRIDWKRPDPMPGSNLDERHAS